MKVSDWTVETRGIQRRVSWIKGSGIRTASLTNPGSGRDFACKDPASEEFRVQIDGTGITGADPDLVLRGSRVEKHGAETTTLIELERDGLGIELSYSCRDGMPVLRRGMRLHNATKDRRFEIRELFASECLSVAMPRGMRASWVNGITDPMSPNVFSYLDFGLEERDLEPGVPRVFTNLMPRDMSNLRQWRRGKIPAVNHSNHSYFPWIVLWDPEGREGMYFGLEWSGPWRVELAPEAGFCRVTVGLGASFHHVLEPGESMPGIDLFEGVFVGGLDEAGADTQRYAEKHLAARPGPEVRPFDLAPACWNSWWAFLTNLEEKGLQAQADEAARLGFEAFVVDYGWSRSAADKREDRGKFPSGLRALSRYVKARGMRFGLWVSFASYDPAIAPTRDPHAWFVRTEEGLVHDEQNIAFTCACLASGYRDHVKEELLRIVADYEVDWLKFDQNVFIECHAKGHEHQNEHDAPYFQVRAFYDILDSLLEKHPALTIECALSGAMILDYGIIQRTHTAWIHDDHRSYFVRRCFYGASFPLPPRYCTTCTAHPSTNWDASAADFDDRKDPAARRRLFDYFYRASVMGAFNVSDDLLKLPTEARDSLAHALRLYKTARRSASGPIRHILPQPRDPREWDAVAVFDETAREGMVFVFRPSSPLAETRIKLQGLDAGMKYEIRSENRIAVIATLNGKELMEVGMKVCIPDTSGSEILHLRALPGEPV